MTNSNDAEEATHPPDSWAALGFRSISVEGEASSAFQMPEGLIGFTVLQADAKDMQAIGGFPLDEMLSVKVEDRSFFFFRLNEDAGRFEGSALPATVRLIQAGDALDLPPTWDNPAIRSVTDIGIVPTHVVDRALAPRTEAEILHSPLAMYSLRGKAAEFANLAIEAKPLLGDLCLSGQATVFYAAPNVGKTLVALKLLDDAVGEARINPGNVYYLNADDSSAGFAEKMQLMDDLGVHTLSPG